MKDQGFGYQWTRSFIQLFFSLVFPFSCCVVSFARRRRREMDINQSDILDVHSSMYTWATGTTHRCSNLPGLFLQEDIFTDIWAKKLQSCDTLYSLGYFLLFRRTIKLKSCQICCERTKCWMIISLNKRKRPFLVWNFCCTAIDSQTNHLQDITRIQKATFINFHLKQRKSVINRLITCSYSL